MPFIFLLVGLTLSFKRPESQEAQSIQAGKKRITVRKIDRGLCPVGLQ